jgi:hypothetical protein
LTLGVYNNFPVNVHHTESYPCTVSNRKLQQQLIQFFGKVNRQKFSFEEVTIPTVPNSRVIFEFGLAETDGFTFLNEAHTKKALEYVTKSHVQILDFFCAICYYKNSYEKWQALKFDYYMLRILFGKGTIELQIYHERGPRYLSPQDLAEFSINSLNNANHKTFKKSNPA